MKAHMKIVRKIKCQLLKLGYKLAVINHSMVARIVATYYI